MATQLQVGTTASVRVPASSANLGPGYDTLGLALSLYDSVSVEVIESGMEVGIRGEGEAELPRDESHLVVAAIRSALRAAGALAPGLRVECLNRIPQSRGLGSSAAAAVAGVAAGNQLAGSPLSTAELVQLASEFEGHPDNAAASVLGGAVVSFTENTNGPGPIHEPGKPTFRAVGVPVHPQLKATALIPDFHASTDEVRKVLPTRIPHADAAFNASRSALLVTALREHPELLFTATEDRLHQPYRAGFLQVSARWVRALREAKVAAFLSGAGPTVLALHTEPVPAELLDSARGEGLTVLELEVAGPVRAWTGAPER